MLTCLVFSVVKLGVEKYFTKPNRNQQKNNMTNKIKIVNYQLNITETEIKVFERPFFSDLTL